MFRIVKHKKEGCQAHGCKNKSPKKDRFCPKHRHRYVKHTNMLRYTYNALKSNAKRRKKSFSLTIEEFKVICFASGYLKGKGKAKSSLTIDRKNPRCGYHVWNVRIITLSENSKKSHYEYEDLPF